MKLPLNDGGKGIDAIPEIGKPADDVDTVNAEPDVLSRTIRTNRAIGSGVNRRDRSGHQRSL